MESVYHDFDQTCTNLFEVKNCFMFHYFTHSSCKQTRAFKLSRYGTRLSLCLHCDYSITMGTWGGGDPEHRKKN